MLRILTLLGLLLGSAAVVEYVIPADDGIAYAQRGGDDGGRDSGDDDNRPWYPEGNSCQRGGPYCDPRISSSTPTEECRGGESARECCARLGGVETCACTGPTDEPVACHRIGVLIILLAAKLPEGQGRYICPATPPEEQVLTWVPANCQSTAAAAASDDIICWEREDGGDIDIECDFVDDIKAECEATDNTEAEVCQQANDAG